jgi:hypothetical protein
MRTSSFLGWLAVGATVMVTAMLHHTSSVLASNPCATSPGDRTEPGTDWYYHPDPVDHRQCWHARPLGQLGQAERLVFVGSLYRCAGQFIQFGA